MKIANLTITNFRGVRAGQVAFGDFTVFVGANNCGKTTVVEALALLTANRVDPYTLIEDKARW